MLQAVVLLVAVAAFDWKKLVRSAQALVATGHGAAVTASRANSLASLSLLVGVATGPGPTHHLVFDGGAWGEDRLRRHSYS